MSNLKPQKISTRLDVPEVSIVVPLFNEEGNIRELHRRVSAALDPLASELEFVFVNDGSIDSTSALLEALEGQDSRVVVIHLTRNFGHQAAITAGIDHARGKAVIVMDGDLQDQPEDLPRFVREWRRGNDVVYAIRKNRKEGVLKRTGYFLFYRLLRAISDLDIPIDSGDFSLMDRRVVETLKGLPEQTRFVRGLRTFVGFRQMGVTCERGGRLAGKPKYSFATLVGLAVDGLVSFSSYPLRLATYTGILTIFVAILLTIWVLMDALRSKTAPQGWASTLLIVLFMGSIQLMSIGIIGEYIRRIFLECKKRPSYIVDKVNKKERVTRKVRIGRSSSLD